MNFDPSAIASGVSPYKNIISSIIKESAAEAKNFFEVGLTNYIEDKKSKFSLTNSFVFSEKVEFYEIFFPLSIRYGKTIIKSESLFDHLFSFSNTCAIVGSAGSGKTMLMKHIFLSYYKELKKIPIFIELRDFNKSEIGFSEFIYKIILGNKVKPNSRILENALNSGKFVFILDGYDEIEFDRKEKLIPELDQFIDFYPTNNYIFSSRPGTGIESFHRLVSFQVQPLKREEIDEFIYIQLKRTQDFEIINKLKETIKKPENKAYLGYLSNPLLLSMFILTFKNYPELPKSKNKFYWNVFDTLCTKHDSITKKGGYSHEKKTKLQSEDFENILKRFCCIALFESQFNFDNQYLSETLKKVRDSLKLNINVDDLIYDLHVSISILVKEGLIFKFPHRTLQDYFTVLFIKEQNDTSKKIIYTKNIVNILNKNGYERNKELFDLFLELDKEAFLEYLALPSITELNNNLKKLQIKDQIVLAIRENIRHYQFNSMNNDNVYSLGGIGLKFSTAFEVMKVYGNEFPLFPFLSKTSDNKITELINKTDTKIFDSIVTNDYKTANFNLSKVDDEIVYELATIANLTDEVANVLKKVNSLEMQISKELEDVKSNKDMIWKFIS